MNLSSWLFNIVEGVGIAFDAIRQNKVRAALTILGVAVGVFVIIRQNVGGLSDRR